MIFRATFCPTIVCILGLNALLAFGGDKTVITHVNANRLLCTIAEQHKLSVVMSLPGKPPVAIDKDTVPSEAVMIVREHDAQTRGRVYGFTKDTRWIGEVQVGVFSDPNVASRVFEDHLRHTSVVPDADLRTSFGNRAVAWSRGQSQGVRRVLFVRDNVVISVYLTLSRLAPGDAAGEATLEIARNIDHALVNGAIGVQRGQSLKVPRIVGIETLGQVLVRAKLTARVRIAVPENRGDKATEEIETVRTLPFYTPGLSPEDKAKPENKVTYYVTYVTPGCVVASKEMTITLRPASPSK